ncbi:MAG: hypothetical protein PVJ14_09245 [Chromatiales bacterium]|jgi:hypothetical protein
MLSNISASPVSLDPPGDSVIAPGQIIKKASVSVSVTDDFTVEYFPAEARDIHGACFDTPAEHFPAVVFELDDTVVLPVIFE